MVYVRGYNKHLSNSMERAERIVLQNELRELQDSIRVLKRDLIREGFSKFEANQIIQTWVNTIKLGADIL